jgi:hypothetical protein
MFAELPGSAKAFYNSIMVEPLNALKLNTFFDNFDAARFNLDGVDRFVIERHRQLRSVDHYTIHGEETVLYCKP